MSYAISNPLSTDWHEPGPGCQALVPHYHHRASPRITWDVADRALRGDVFAAIDAELDRAYAKHGREQWGRHEWYAITLEELEEAWDAVKADRPLSEVRAEIIQVAAMCVRYLETGDRYLEPASDRVQSREGGS